MSGASSLLEFGGSGLVSDEQKKKISDLYN